jgi:two-component system, chemotaxis family, response regulator Rcp1
VTQALEILLVEDSPADAYLTLEALRDTRTLCDVHVVRDGVEALRFLRRHAPHAAAPRPDVILLDLNLPQIDGKELLAEIKSDELLLDIPVVVLTGSASPDDINYAYRHHVACYITKSPQLEEYMTAVKTLKELLFHTASFPKKPAAERISI